MPIECHIRSARAADAAFVAAMVQLSMGHLAGYLFQADRGSVLSSIMEMFLRDAGRFGSGITHIAEDAGRPVGVLVACGGGRVNALNLATLPHLFPVLGIGHALRMIWKGIRLPGGREAEEDEYYISNIGVPPAAQGCGVGSQLLGFAEQSACRLKLEKCSLIVGLQNRNAFRLYQRLGYQVVETVRDKNDVLGYHRMVKVLRPQ